MANVKLSKIFEVTYGTKFDMNKMTKNDDSKIVFVSRSSKNNGIVGYVDKVKGVEPLEPGLITVTLGGTYVLSSFLQEKVFYTGQNVAVLKSKIELTKGQKLFYCLCISKNRFRYSAFGREANRTLKDLLVPEPNDIPKWVTSVNLSVFDGVDEPKVALNAELPDLNNTVTIDCIFDVENGIVATKLKEKDVPFDESIMYVRPAATQARTLRSYIDRASIPKDKIFPEGSLFVSTNGEGSHSYAYVSTCEFVPNSDVSVLIPKREMTIQEKLFYAQCITSNRYLFSYGRKPKGNKLKSIKVPKLIDDDIEKVISYINSLPYSSNI
ncbi:TPA: restriction endonuclease subunit S [Morganella morganii]|nr:restriction endonuclease subunit S [Morganella morganii]